MKKLLSLLLLLLLVIPACSSYKDADYTSKDDVLVTLNTDDNCKVVGDKTISIKKGETAEYIVEPNKYYVLDDIDYGTSELKSDGKYKISIPSVEFNKTYYVSASLGEFGKLTIINDSNKGAVNISSEEEYYPYGAKINLSLTPKDDNVFFCYTKGEKLDKEMVPNIVSFSKNMTIEIDGDITLYVNYYEEEANTYLFNYKLNGGSLIDGGSEEDIYYPHYITYYHKRVNTLHGTNYIKRDGYSLIGWNTKSDGSGEHIGLGCRVTQHIGINTLYAEWKKWDDITNYEYEINGNNITLTRCLSDKEELVIPQMFEGKVVSSIAPHFGDNLPARNIYFPLGLYSIQRQAFNDCDQLENIFFYDSLVHIYDNTFVNCSLKHMRVNAVTFPVFNKHYIALMADKYDRMILSNRKRIILHSDSVVFTSTYSKYIDDAFGDEYDVINFATAGLFNLGLSCVFLEDLVKDGDIVVNMNLNTFYYDDASYRRWYAFESNYDMLAHIDLTKFTHGAFSCMFSTYTANVLSEKDMPYLPYDTYTAFYMNNYGDFSTENGTDYYYCYDHDPDWYFQKDSTSFTTLPYERFEYINDFCDAVHAKNAYVYRAYAPYNGNALAPNSDTPEERQAFHEYYSSLLHMPFISDIEDHLFTGDYFGIDDHHCVLKGAQKQTLLLVDELRVQMTIDGLLS